MARVFHACIRAIRRSPNIYAVICGCLLVAVTQIYYGLAFESDAAANSGRFSLVTAFAKVGWRYVTDSYVGALIVMLTVCIGFTLILLGMTRIFPPK